MEKRLDLDYFAKIKLIRQERKVLEDMKNQYLKKQGPKGYPSSIMLSERVQNNSQTPEAERVYNELLELMEEINTRLNELKAEESEIINTMKRIKDSTIRNVLYARYVLEMSFKEIKAKYGIRKQNFFKKIKNG